MTFPLFRLPLLATIEVIKNTDAKYLFTLIQLSKRAKTLVKLSKVHIELSVFPYSIQFQNLAHQGEGQWLVLSDLSARKTDGPFKPPCPLKIDRGDKHQIGAYKKVLDDLMEFFKVCSISFELGTGRSYTNFPYITHAKNMGLSLAQVVIDGSNGGIHWFTVDHMCALVNCSEVFVKDLRWSCEDLNRFLKFWVTCDGRLKSLVSYTGDWKRHSVNVPALMNGIDFRVLGTETFEIQRADGVKTKLEFNPLGFNLTVIDV